MLRTSEAPIPSPFKFLDYYEEADAPVFGGRDQEVLDIISHLSSREALVVYGKSGTGKTSLLLAGVFPAVRVLQWHPIYVRMIIEPVEELRRAIQYEIGHGSEIRVEDLPRLVGKHSQNRPMLLVLDQFEEFFIRFGDNEHARRQFVTLLGNIKSLAAGRCRFLFSLRENYLANMDDFQSALPETASNRYRIQTLTAYGAREAITRPLIKANVEFSDRLISELLDILARFNFDPVIVQIICVELFRQAARRQGSDTRQLDVEDLYRIGGVEGIFISYLEKLESDTADEQRLLLRLTLDALISREETKIARTINDLLQQPFLATRDEIGSILELLRIHRLIRREIRGTTEWFELTHDRLIGTLRRWLRRDVAFFNFTAARDLVENSVQSGQWRKNPDLLLSRGQLQRVIRPFWNRLRLDSAKKLFLFLSALYARWGDSRWLGLMRRDRAEHLLLLLMSSKHVRLRNGAVRAMEQLKVQNPRVLQKAVELALRDADGEVRRAAGRLLAHTAGPQEFGRLKAALRDTSTHRQALEVVADFQLARPYHSPFGTFSRIRGRRIANMRVFRRSAQLISQRSRIGAVIGLLAALGWWLTAGFGYTAILSLFSLQAQQRIWLVIQYALPLLVLACIVGLLFGYFVAWTAVRRKLVGLSSSWARDLLCSPAYVLPPIFFYILAGSLMVAEPPPVEMVFQVVFGLFATPVVFWAGIPFGLLLAESTLGPRPGRWQATVAALIASVIVPWSIAVLLIFFEDRFWEFNLEGLLLRVVSIMIPVTSCVLFVATAASIAGRKDLGSIRS